MLIKGYMFDVKQRNTELLTAKIVEIINNCTLIVNVFLNNENKNINCVLYNISRLDVSSDEGRYFKALLSSLLPVGTEIKLLLNAERRSKPIPNSHLITIFINEETKSLNDFLIEKRKLIKFPRINRMATIKKETVKKETYIRNAIVKRIIDADTLVLNVDLGCDININMTTRLDGINAPEKNTEEGVLAKKWIEDNLPLETKVVIQTVKDKKEKFGRYLAIVFKDKETVSINDTMVSLNLAEAYSGGKRVPANSIINKKIN